MNARALTLVEVLAVIVVLSAATTLLVGAGGALGARNGSARAVTTLVDALEGARELAESAPEPAVGRPVVALALGETLVATAPHSGLPAHRSALPPGWRPEIERTSARDAHANDESILFWSRRGRIESDDAVVALYGPAGAGARVELLGISGQVRRLEGVRP